MSPRDSNTQFKECPVCAAKPGSPTLCHSCLTNRDTISKLNARFKVYVGMVDKIDDFFEYSYSGETPLQIRNKVYGIIEEGVKKL